jgi:hypothetical protein
VALDDTVGSITVADAGHVALLYTNATDSDHLTIFDTDTLSVVRTVVVEAPIAAVLPAPDGKHAVALLKQAPGSSKQGGFSVVPLGSNLPPKIVGTDAPPISVALGSHQALITIEGKNSSGAAVHGAYLAQMPALSTKPLTLASPPLSAGLIEDVGLGFIAQSHPEGRITFIELASGKARTLTGFELASRVVQGE